MSLPDFSAAGDRLPDGVHGPIAIREGNYKGRPGYLLSGADTPDGRFPRVDGAIRVLVQAKAQFLPARKWWFVPLGGEQQIRMAIERVTDALAGKTPTREDDEHRQPSLDPARFNSRGGYEGSLFKGENSDQWARPSPPRPARKHPSPAAGTGRSGRRATKSA